MPAMSAAECSLSVEGHEPKPDPLADRKRLTFQQAEGAEPLAQQLRLGELSPVFRAAVWSIVYNSIKDATDWDSFGGAGPDVGDPWDSILRVCPETLDWIAELSQHEAN
jgi:hypothetical protein